MKTTEAACVSDELCCFKEEEEEEDGQILSCIDRVCDRLASLSLLTIRVVALEYSQLHKMPYNLVVCEFGGFENVLHDVGICAIPT